MNLTKLEIIIEDQIQQNIFKNIYDKEIDSFSFSAQIIEIVRLIKLHNYSQETIENLITSMSNIFIKKLMTYNQFLQFSEQQVINLNYIYKQLYLDIINNYSIDTIKENHYNRIRNFLYESNPTHSLLDITSNKINTYVCEEYSAKFQLDILNIKNVIEPILDIGCGYHGNLVTYFNDNNKEAYGIDRECQKDNDYLYNYNWLDFQYDQKQWGTIISNMAFSNHFLHLYHLHENIAQYIMTYYKILKSLKVGGSFYYAPSLPFIECSLSREEYNVIVEELDYQISRTVVTRYR